MNKYKIPWHVKQYVKRELMDYKANKRLLAKTQNTDNSRGLILARLRIQQIENVMERLDKEDKDAAEIIFIDQYTQAGAEMLGMSKSAFYRAMDKIIFLTAKEMDLI